MCRCFVIRLVYLRPLTTIRLDRQVKVLAWPLHDIAITNIVWCVAHERGVGGGACIARYCVWAKYRGAK